METKIKTFLEEINKITEEVISRVLTNDEPLVDGLYLSASYSANGGKHVRSLYTYLVGKIFNVEPKKMLKTACAIELIHAASIIMVDLPYMGDSQLRRGKPANQVVFGQDVSLCASIGLLSEAVHLVLKDVTLDNELRLKVAQIVTNSYGFKGLAAGQFVDQKLKRKNIDFQIIEFINAKKTAALFSAAGLAGATIGGALKEELSAIEEYSINIGFAFQIIDDIIDVVDNKNIIGNETSIENKNFVMLVGKDEASKQAKEYTRKANKAIEIFGDKSKGLKTLSEFLLNRIH